MHRRVPEQILSGGKSFGPSFLVLIKLLDQISLPLSCAAMLKLDSSTIKTTRINLEVRFMAGVLYRESF
jgi:hypothetical protein